MQGEEDTIYLYEMKLESYLTWEDLYSQEATFQGTQCFYIYIHTNKQRTNNQHLQLYSNQLVIRSFKSVLIKWQL